MSKRERGKEREFKDTKADVEKGGCYEHLFAEVDLTTYVLS